MSARPAARARPEPALATLFLGGAVASVAVALVHTGWLAQAAGVGRVRELAAFTLARLVAEAFGVSLLAWLPHALDVPFDLRDPRGLAGFLGVALPASIALAWALAAVAIPLVVAAAALGGRLRARLPAWGSGPTFPAAVVTAFAVPGVFTAIHALLFGRSPRIVVAATVGASAVVFLALVAGLRRPGALTRLVARAGAGAAALAVVAGVAGFAVGVRGPGRTVGPQPAAAAGAPNVLVVSIDSLRRDHLHCYGYGRETSPTIDALAREGARFVTVASPTSWTLPAHLTLFTALPPELHGVTDDGLALGADVRTLPEVLWQAGYATAGFVSGPYLNAMYGFGRGFDHYDDYTAARLSDRASHRGQTSPALLEIVSEWLDGWDAGGRTRPFFVFLHMWDVHYDYTPPPPYDRLFDPGYTGTVTGEDFETGSQVHAGMDARDLEHVVALYDGEIRFTDLYLGRVLDRLRGLGVLDRTLVVVTADHGDEFFEHGRKGHGKALYDETILVPLVVRFPAAVPAGTVVDRQVRLMDVAPTVLGLSGVPAPADFGTPAPKGPWGEHDLGPWLRGRAAGPLDLRAFGDLRGTDVPVPLAYARTERTKLIEAGGAGGRVELYDLAADPGEHDDRAAREPDGVASMAGALHGVRARWAARGDAAEHIEIGAAQQERLRALGYLQ